MSHQPAPYYYPRQPPKKSSMGTIILVIVVVVALVAGLGGFAAYQIYQVAQQNGGVGGSTTTTTTKSNTKTISGSYLTESVPFTNNSIIDMTCNYCTITLYTTASSIRANLDITGNYNHVTITHGQVNISVTGNYNVVNAQQTIVLSVQDTGTGNTIQR